MSLEEESQTTLHLLSDVDCANGSEIYKLLMDDINLFQSFFIFDDLIQVNQTREDLEKLTSSETFKQFEHEFDQFIKNKKIYDFHWIFQILSFLFQIRPKLHPLIAFLFPIVINNYSSSINEIKYYIENRSESHYFSSFIKSIFFEGINIEEFLLSKDEHENERFLDCDIIRHEILSKQIEITFYPQTYSSKEDNEEEYKIFQIIYNDDCEQLISYLSEHPTFDIHSNIEISNSLKLKSFIIDEDSISLLDFCCFIGSPKCFKYFCMNECTLSDLTPQYSIIGGNFEIIQILNQNNVEFDDCFYLSIKYHRYSISNWLLTNYECEPVSEEDCIQNYNFKGFLFIHYNQYLHYDILQKDYEQEYDGDEEDDEQTIYPLPYFCLIGYLPIVQYLFSKYQLKSKNDPIFISSAGNSISAGHLPILEFLFNHGCSMELKTKQGLTFLHIACLEGYFKVVEYYINHGFDKESKTNDGLTALHIATREGYLNIVEFLIGHGCDIEAITKTGLTPLHFASMRGYLDIVKFLIKHGSNKEAKDFNGYTAMLFSSAQGYLDIVKYLYNIGCNLDVKSKSSLTPLHMACERNQLQVVIFLIEHGCNKESKCSSGFTPLHMACSKNNLEIVTYLVNNGCDKESRATEGCTPLYIACQEGYFEIVQFLANQGCNIDAKLDDGFTPLHVACQQGFLEIVRFLMNQGCNKEARTSDGRTPLHIACQEGQYEIVQFLISQGCNKDAETNKGQTPLYIAFHEGYLNIVQFLANPDGSTPVYLAFCDDHVELVMYK